MAKGLRHEAKLLGHKTYFNGKPCPHGHIADRRTDNGICCECGRIRSLNRQRLLWETEPEKQCERARRNAQNPKSKERCKKYSLEYRSANAEDCRLRAQNYYRNNSERINKKSREYEVANREAIRSTRLAWQAKNPEQHAQIKKRSKCARKARLANAAYEPVTLLDIINSDGPHCYICARHVNPNAAPLSPEKAELEHVTPLSRGGTHLRENLRCVCSPCNRHKGASRSPSQVRELVFAKRPGMRLYVAITRASKRLIVVGT